MMKRVKAVRLGHAKAHSRRTFPPPSPCSLPPSKRKTAAGEQAPRVAAMLDAAGFERARVVSDCFGAGRFVEAWRRPR